MKRLMVVTATTVALLWSAAPAWAHVTVSPSEVPRGGFQVLTFRVPNEEADASTVKLEVTFPADQPLAFASVQPTPGWQVKVDNEKLAEPIQSDDGPVTEAVSKITWSGGAVGPGEFQQFYVSAGPFPDAGDKMEFKAVQTYSNGDVVRWIEDTPEGGPEPEHPAPAITLVAAADENTSTTPTTAGGASGDAASAASSNTASQDDVDSAKTLAIVGIVIGALGLVAAAAAFATRRRAAS
jgi:MYXO-CTERM domain-containing protein